MRKILLLAALCIPSMSFAQLLALFKNTVDSIYEKNKDAIGIIVHVESPKQHISWSYAKGDADSKTNKLLDNQQPVLIASNTKPYVAAAVLRLVEKRKITIDQAIKKLLTHKTRKLFEKDGYDLNAITVKHLLSHTSGIQDYVD